MLRTASTLEEQPLGAQPAATTSPENPTPRPAGFRRDLEGLRGLAIAGVVAFHLWVGGVSGGVDIFFVISAFLMTGSLLRKYQRGKPLGVLGFWERTFARLKSREAIVVLLVVIASSWLYPVSRWEATFSQGIATLLGGQNLYLGTLAVDYYNRSTVSLSPLQHAWSLSLQAQVFLIWPLLLWLVFRCSTWLKIPARTALAVALSAVFAMSLSWSIYLTATEPQGAYFSTPARLWEFAVGGLAACFAVTARPRRVQPTEDNVVIDLRTPARSNAPADAAHAPMAPWRRALAWVTPLVGLALVVGTPLIFGAEARYPGWVALGPTLGAALVLLIDPQVVRARWSVPRLLSFPPLVWLGAHAFGLYLWHWPILVGYRVWMGTDDVPVAHGIAIIAAALLADALLSVILSGAARLAGRRAGARTTLAATAMLSAAVIGTVAALPSSVLPKGQALVWEGVSIGDTFPGATVFTGRDNVPRTDKFLAIPTDRGEAWVPQGDPCPADAVDDHTAEIGLCHELRYGPDEAPTIAVVGDSHAQQMLAAVDVLARENSWNIWSHLYGACRYGSEPVDIQPPHCQETMGAVEDAVRELQPDLVIMVGSRAHVEAPYENVLADLVDRTDTWREDGIPVLIVRDNPRFEQSLLECSELYGVHGKRCQRPLEEALPGPNPLTNVANANDLMFTTDFTDIYCPDGACRPVVGNVAVYLDDSHISRYYSESMSEIFAERSHDALGAYWPGDASFTRVSAHHDASSDPE